MIHRYLKLASVATLAASAAPISQAQDWPQWRGPSRDGAVTSFSEPSPWPVSLSERWKAEVGLGYATPVLVGSRIFMYTRQNEDE
ncbi:MAG TPA: serine/threonine protein kinase, partial [Vicinamibacteria bacterium]|nr:serine/threonine protein kinase [Vicinamibacteria bacterium]